MQSKKKKRIIIATTICTMLSINGRAFLQVLIINLMVAYLLCKDPQYLFRYLWMFQVLRCIKWLKLTVWKLDEFSISQILREIDFWDFRNAKSAILTHLEVLNFDFNEFLQFIKAEIFLRNKIQGPKIGKNGTFRSSTFSKIDFT